MAEANARLSDRAWLEKRYRHDGVSVAAIAAEAGADPSSVHRWLDRHGIALTGGAGRRSIADLSDETVRDAVRHADGLADAARRLGVHRDTLHERLVKMGERAYNGGEAGADEMAVEYGVGETVAAIADRHGVSIRTVRRRLVAAGVEMRGRGRRRSSA